MWSRIILVFGLKEGPKATTALNSARDLELLMFKITFFEVSDVVVVFVKCTVLEPGPGG